MDYESVFNPFNGEGPFFALYDHISNEFEWRVGGAIKSQFDFLKALNKNKFTSITQ